MKLPFFGNGQDDQDNNNNNSSKSDYWDETARGLANALAHLGDTWYGPESVYYDRERQQLEEKYVKPFYYGMAASAFLFVNFRVTGSTRFQTWRQTWIRQQKRRQQVQQQQAPPHQNQSSSLQQQRQTPQAVPLGYLESQRQAQIKHAMVSMKLLTDLLVSISVGVSGTLFILHGSQDTMRHDFEQAPLVAGKSVVAQHMCPPLLQVAASTATQSQQQQQQQQQQQVHSSNNTHNNNAKMMNVDNMRTFQTFVDNCQRRLDYERQVRRRRRRTQGTFYGQNHHNDGHNSDDSPDESVIVPHPGL